MRVQSLERINAASADASPPAITVNLEVNPGAAASSNSSDGGFSWGPTSRAADLVMWTAGSAPATKALPGRAGFPFPTDQRGSVLTVSDDVT
jgi:hypothetical protein